MIKMNYQEIYNKAAYAAINCNKDRVKANQINQLLSIFNSSTSKKLEHTIMLLITFVMRQTSRNLFRKSSSSAIISVLEIVLGENIREEDKKSEIRDFLGLLKWFFEVADKIRVNWNAMENESFDSIVNDFKKWAIPRR